MLKQWSYYKHFLWHLNFAIFFIALKMYWRFEVAKIQRNARCRFVLSFDRRKVKWEKNDGEDVTRPWPKNSIIASYSVFASESFTNSRSLNYGKPSQTVIVMAPIYSHNFPNRSRSDMTVQQRCGENCPLMQNWLQGRAKQTRTKRYTHS